LQLLQSTDSFGHHISHFSIERRIAKREIRVEIKLSLIIISAELIIGRAWIGFCKWLSLNRRQNSFVESARIAIETGVRLLVSKWKQKVSVDCQLSDNLEKFRDYLGPVGQAPKFCNNVGR
jgi:hypothetical protein